MAPNYTAADISCAIRMVSDREYDVMDDITWVEPALAPAMVDMEDLDMDDISSTSDVESRTESEWDREFFDPPVRERVIAHRSNFPVRMDSDGWIDANDAPRPWYSSVTAGNAIDLTGSTRVRQVIDLSNSDEEEEEEEFKRSRLD